MSGLHKPILNRRQLPTASALTKNVLSTRLGRLFTFGTLYISEGVPLGFTATAMGAYMRREGLDVAQIGTFVGMLYLPWAFKWAWAPLVDMFRLERFGGRRAWISICLLMMILTLIVVALIDYNAHFQLMLVLVFIHNIFAATQDVAIDALAVSSLHEDERGTGNGFMFGGAYVGQGLGGGGALFVSGLFGFGAALAYACILMTGILVFTQLFVRDPDVRSDRQPAADNPLREAVQAIRRIGVELFNGMFRSGKGPMVGFLFALTPIGAMSLTNAIGTTLQVDYGLVDADIAQISLYSTILAGIGCVVGGIVGDRFGLRKMIAIFYALSAVPVIWLALRWGADAALPAISKPEFFAVFLAAGLTTGFHYGISAGVFMGLTNPAVAATQFTGFMALANLTIAYTNNWQGWVAENIDYTTVLWIDAALVIVPILVLPFMTPREVKEEEVAPSAGAPIPEAS